MSTRELHRPQVNERTKCQQQNKVMLTTNVEVKFVDRRYHNNDNNLNIMCVTAASNFMKMCTPCCYTLYTVQLQLDSLVSLFSLLEHALYVRLSSLHSASYLIRTNCDASFRNNRQRASEWQNPSRGKQKIRRKKFKK